MLSADRIPAELSEPRPAPARPLRVGPDGRGRSRPTSPCASPSCAASCRESGIEISDRDALAELAGRIDSNVRQLHGALTRAIAHASLMASPLSRELVAEVIPASAPSRPRPAAEEIQSRVAESFGVSRAELVGTARAATPLRARQVAIYLTREKTDLSLPQIGRLFGGRDHTTVLNSIRRVEAVAAEDPDLRRKIETLRTAIHSERH